MLKSLHIQNIVLVEDAHVPFTKGLNVLSGETGSGKSAVMDALSLVLGERADGTILRRGSDKGVVEASFDIKKHTTLKQVLQDSGIDHDVEHDLIIRRELNSSGKSRAFINDQLAQLPLLRKVGAELVQIVGQHSNQRLFSIEYHRDVLDLYGNLSSELSQFKKSYEKELSLKEELDALIKSESQRLRDTDRLTQELEELDEAALKDNEDEELFAEYSRLSNVEELSLKLHDVNQSLSSVALLNRQKGALEDIVKMDQSLEETGKNFTAALLELQEVAHTLQRYASRLSHDPSRLQSINERLTLINRCKRKYGQTLSEIEEYRKEALAKLKNLEMADLHIEELQHEIRSIEEQTHAFAAELTVQRQKIAKKLEKAITEQLRSLNMPKAECHITISSQKRSMAGDDKIEFFLIPNKGENQVALRDGASGGEISRFLLALQTLLAGKEKIPILIFDEVDANIGGETASTVGEKLKSISVQHQIVFITHFPQVASHAEHHLQISKHEKNGRTVTIIRHLDELTKAEEFGRMVGKKSKT